MTGRVAPLVYAGALGAQASPPPVTLPRTEARHLAASETGIGLRRMASTLDGRGYPGLRQKWDVAEDETHNSIFPRALSDGLRFVLEGRWGRAYHRAGSAYAIGPLVESPTIPTYHSH